MIFTALPIIALLATISALPTPNNVPLNSTVAPPRARSVSNHIAALNTRPETRSSSSAIVKINVPSYTSMLPDSSEDKDALTGPGTIGVQIWEHDVAGYEWKIKEKAVRNNGEDVYYWSSQCNLTLASSVSSEKNFVFILSASDPYISGDVDDEASFKCADVQCINDEGCGDDYDPSFDTSSA